ncbi:shikimate dehydrogenase [Neisseriaceae bacterium B1]
MIVYRHTVFGNPIAHSKSPQIHQLFAAQHGIEIDYTRTLVSTETGAFAQAAQDFFAQGGCGANVTLPFKTAAYEFCQTLSDEARAAGAANTLIRQADGTILGHNTDGIGLVRDLTEHLAQSLRGKRLLILGAGGATRGIVLPLLARQPESITIANRSPEKAINLAKQFQVQAARFDELNSGFDVVMNATSSSVSQDLPAVSAQIFSGCLMAYDLFYAPEPTRFMQWASEHGAAQTADGLGMLVGQAAAAYEAWHGFAPDISPVIKQMKQEIAA